MAIKHCTHGSDRKECPYASKAECYFAETLEEQGVVVEYEPKRFKYTQPATNHYYTPDFKLPNGIFIEYKGYFRPKDRQLALNVRRDNPDVDIRFVFTKATNKLNKSSPTTYATWCDKNDFKYSELTIPTEWLEERVTDDN